MNDSAVLIAWIGAAVMICALTAWRLGPEKRARVTSRLTIGQKMDHPVAGGLLLTAAAISAIAAILAIFGWMFG